MKNKNVFALSIVIALAAYGLAACSPASPKLIAEPQITFEKIDDKTNDLARRPSVDILFVVDDSASMENHQANLANNIDLFVDEFSKLKVIDYHIGVISTSADDSGGLRGYPKYVEASTLDGAAFLKKNIKLGTNGSGTEQMFDPVTRALSPYMIGGINSGFYRQDAYLIVIFISDAEDQSYIYDPNTFMNFVVNLKGSKDKILSYGAIIPSGADTTDCARDQWDEPKRTEDYLGLNINAGRNVVWLCDPQFGSKLVEFSKEIVKTVNKPIILSRVPIVSTIKIMFGTQEIISDPVIGWYFDVKQNAIIFGEKLVIDESQPKGTKLSITFDAANFGK